MSDYYTITDDPGGTTPLFDFGATAKATRAAAAENAKAKQPSRRDQVIDYLRSRGDCGATRHEIAEAMGWPLSSVCSPVHALLLDQVIVEDGRRRPTPYGSQAAVLVLSPGGEG